MSAKKRILVFIDWFLPGFRAGGPIQSCANLVDHLSTEFDFFIVTRDTDYCETDPYKDIKSNAWNKMENGCNVFYLSKSKLNISSIQKLCKRTPFDYVYINGVYSFYFSILPLYFFRNLGHKKVIVASRGMLAKSAIQVKKGKKAIFLKLANKLGLFSNITFQASTAAEVEDIKSAIGKSAYVNLAGNLPKINKVKQQITIKEKESGLLKLINIARIAPEKNLKFALEILKDVKSEVFFDFYGPVYNEEYFESCKVIWRQLPRNIHVNYKSSIESTKVSAIFENYHALFMPTLGENFGHIILESLVAGCPVIISDQTPWQNLQNRKMGFAIPLNERTKFIEAIEYLAKLKKEEFMEYSKASFQFGKEYVNNPEILKQNLNLFA